MKHQFLISIAVVAVSFALLDSQNVHAQNATVDAVNSAQGSGNAVAPGAQDEAMQMVPAQAVLAGSIDARKAQAGQEFKATLSYTIHLKNGPELPHGTRLVGTIAMINTQKVGPSLALSFTKAELKDGQVVPIKAMIVGVAPPAVDPSRDPNASAEAIWTPKTLQIDDVDALSGVDLHSRVAADNSGVFVATRKSDVKLSQGSCLALAIEAQGAGAQEVSGANGPA